MDRFKLGAGDESVSKKVYLEDDSDIDLSSLDEQTRNNLTRLKGY